MTLPVQETESKVARAATPQKKYRVSGTWRTGIPQRMRQNNPTITEPQRRWIGNPSQHIYCFEHDPMAIKLVAKGIIEFQNDYCASRRGFRLTDTGRIAFSKVNGGRP